MKKINKMIEEVEALDDNFKISKDILLIRLKDCKEELDKQLTLTDVVGRSEQLKVVEKLKDFAYEVCPLHREDDLEEIVGRL